MDKSDQATERRNEVARYDTQKDIYTMAMDASN